MNIYFHFSRHLIRAESNEDYQQRLSSIITRWPHAFTTYFMVHVSPEIPMFALWTMRAWEYPSTEDSIITSNQCEHVNRLAAEQQAWIECPIDVAFHIGRDLQRAKLVELGRGLIGVGNFELLPEFRKRDDIGKG